MPSTARFAHTSAGGRAPCQPTERTSQPHRASGWSRSSSACSAPRPKWNCRLCLARGPAPAGGRRPGPGAGPQRGLHVGGEVGEGGRRLVRGLGRARLVRAEEVGHDRSAHSISVRLCMPTRVSSRISAGPADEAGEQAGHLEVLAVLGASSFGYRRRRAGCGRPAPRGSCRRRGGRSLGVVDPSPLNGLTSPRHRRPRGRSGPASVRPNRPSGSAPSRRPHVGSSGRSPTARPPGPRSSSSRWRC